MAKVFYQSTDKDLLTGAQAFSTAITLSPTTYGLTAAQATQYATTYTTYSTAYATIENQSTRTPVTLQNKDLARAALVALTKSLVSFVNGTTTVTNGQRVALGLNPKTPNTPIPAPTDSPSIEVISTTGRTVKIRVHDGSVPKKSKPAGVKSATIFSYVGATAPTGLVGWKYEGVVTKSVVDIIFPDTVANGAQVWITGFWSNAKMQNGPAADPVTTNIPGGGVSMAA